MDTKEIRCTCDIPCHLLRGWSGDCKCGCKKCDPTKNKCQSCKDMYFISDYCDYGDMWKGPVTWKRCPECNTGVCKLCKGSGIYHVPAIGRETCLCETGEEQRRLDAEHKLD